MENKENISTKEEYKDIIVITGKDIKSCVYDEKGTPYCFVGLPKASIGIRKEAK
jgi:hypothetical protein